MRPTKFTQYFFFLVITFAVFIGFFFLFQNYHSSPTKAQDNSLTLRIKLPGERYPGSLTKSTVILYNPQGKVKEYTDVTFTYQADKVFEGVISFDPTFDYNTLYAIVIKPNNYFGQLFCSESIHGKGCTSPQFIFKQTSNLVDLSKLMFFGGDISPANGKVDAYDISKIMANLGKSDDTSTDINDDGMTNSIDYLLALYSLSNNISDDAITLVVVPPSPSPTVSITTTPSTTLSPTAILSVTPVPTTIPTINPTSTPIPTPTSIPPADTPIERKVLVIDFNPLLESQGGKRLREYKGWGDPIALENQYINDIKTTSHSILNYKIAQRIANIDAYPEKSNGYIYSDESYLALVSNPNDNARALINYNKLLTDYSVCDKVNNGEISELWIWGGPWFGYYEAVMAGQGAYATNGTPIPNTSCTKKLHIMGFSYERGVSEMIENLGHRTEGTMRVVFAVGGDNDWDRYIKNPVTNTGGSFAFGCGSIHNPFNSAKDYDWENASIAINTCEAWLSYPPAPTSTKSSSCSIWGCNGYGYKKMWFTNLPHVSGLTNGKWNNWWKYVSDILP